MLFTGTLFAREEFYEKGVDRLRSVFGPVLSETAPEQWAYSECYRDELGWPITRRFVFFESLIGEDRLKDAKISINRIEAELSVDGRRQINIDPGYLTLAKVILSTKKDYSHRIYLGEGVFAEAALIYRDETFQPHVFTYPDYRSENNIRMFNRMREVFSKMVQ